MFSFFSFAKTLCFPSKWGGGYKRDEFLGYFWIGFAIFALSLGKVVRKRKRRRKKTRKRKEKGRFEKKKKKKEFVKKKKKWVT